MICLYKGGLVFLISLSAALLRIADWQPTDRATFFPLRLNADCFVFEASLKFSSFFPNSNFSSYPTAAKLSEKIYLAPCISWQFVFSYITRTDFLFDVRSVKCQQHCKAQPTKCNSFAEKDYRWRFSFSSLSLCKAKQFAAALLWLVRG